MDFLYRKSAALRYRHHTLTDENYVTGPQKRPGTAPNNINNIVFIRDDVCFYRDTIVFSPIRKTNGELPARICLKFHKYFSGGQGGT